MATLELFFIRLLEDDLNVFIVGRRDVDRDADGNLTSLDSTL